MSIQKAQKVQAQPRLRIQEGMTVAEVKKYGSDGQKLAASLFDMEGHENADGDFVKDGIYSKMEAEYFNQFNFSVRNNIFTMYNRKSGQVTEIRYNDPKDLKKLFDDTYNVPHSLSFFNDDELRRVCIENDTKGGKITLDLTECKVTADGVEGDCIWASGKKVTVKNSDLKKICPSFFVEELDIQNTRDKGLIFDSATKVSAYKYTNIKLDDKSDVQIER